MTFKEYYNQIEESIETDAYYSYILDARNSKKSMFNFKIKTGHLLKSNGIDHASNPTEKPTKKSFYYEVNFVDTPLKFKYKQECILI
jgi:hypothetical protein